MKTTKRAIPTNPVLNLSMHRCVLQETGDVLSALIVELILYRFNKNGKKPVWLKVDWIRERLPYISRSGMGKKLEKLEKDGHIIVKRGKGKHYHKCWYSPSSDVLSGQSLDGHDKSKTYYNPGVASAHLEASVVFAAIINLLKIQDDLPVKTKGSKRKIGIFHGRVDDELLLDCAKLAEGSGLTLRQVRKGVKWLIENKKLEAKKLFGNKRLVRLPAATPLEGAKFESYSSLHLPTESFPHSPPPEDPTECYPHED
jgi:hypothetical protein